MVFCFDCDFCGVPGDLYSVCADSAKRADWRKRAGAGVWDCGICVHAVCGGAGGKKTSADLETGTSAGLDARALVARVFGVTADFVSWWISFWRNADARFDVADDYYGCQWRLWRGAAKLFTTVDDKGRTARNDLRRNRACTALAARRSRSCDGSPLWATWICVQI